jgi:hypothetical protein
MKSKDIPSYDHPCPWHGDGAFVDRSRWVSCHRTSCGVIVYYRCSCGRAAIALVDSDCAVSNQTGNVEDARRFGGQAAGANEIATLSRNASRAYAWALRDEQ